MLLLVSTALAAGPKIGTVPDVDMCAAVRETFVDEIVRTVVSERYPYSPPPASGPAAAPEPWAPTPPNLMRATIRVRQAPEALPGAIRGPHLGDPALHVTDGRRLFLFDPDAHTVQIFAARDPRQRLGLLEQVGTPALTERSTGPLWLSPGGFLLVVSSVADTTGPAPPITDRNTFGSPMGHFIGATRVTAWDVRDELSSSPAWTIDVEGAFAGVYTIDDRIALVTAAAPAPSNALWQVAHELDDGMPAPVPGPGADRSAEAMATYEATVAAAEARLREVLSAQPADVLMAPRGRYRVDGGPWVAGAATCADAGPGRGGADVLVQVATIDPLSPDSLSVTVLPIAGTLARHTQVDASDGVLWIAGADPSHRYTDVHRASASGGGLSWVEGRLAGPRPQRFLAGPGRLAVLQRDRFDAPDEHATLIDAESGQLRAKSLGPRPPGAGAVWEGAHLVLTDGDQVSLVDVDGKVIERVASRKWTLGSSAPVGGLRLVSATRVVSTQPTTEVGPGFSMLAHTLLAVDGGAQQERTLFGGTFHDQAPQLGLWADPSADRVWVVSTRGDPGWWWCSAQACATPDTSAPRAALPDGAELTAPEVVAVGDTTFYLWSHMLVTERGARTERIRLP